MGSLRLEAGSLPLPVVNSRWCWFVRVFVNELRCVAMRCLQGWHFGNAFQVPQSIPFLKFGINVHPAYSDACIYIPKGDA